MVGLPFRPRRKIVHWTFFSSNWLAPAQPIFRTCSFSSPTGLVIKKILTFVRILFGADGGTRTHMVSRMILSHVRLPVPPHRHMGYYTIYFIYLQYFLWEIMKLEV